MGNAFFTNPKRGDAMADLYVKATLAYDAAGFPMSKAKELAMDRITAGHKVVYFGNGHKQYVPDTVDEGKLTATINQVYDNWNTLGVMTKEGQSVSSLNPRKVFKPHIHGNKVVFAQPGIGALFIRGKDGGRATLTIDLETYEVDQTISQEEPSSYWNSVSVKMPAQGNAETRLDRITNQLLSDRNLSQSMDPTANNFSNLKSVRYRLQGLSAIIRTGELPDWTFDFLKSVDALEPKSKAAFKFVQEHWKSDVETGFNLPSGVDASPLELLARSIKEANSQRYRHKRKRQQKSSGGN